MGDNSEIFRMVGVVVACSRENRNCGDLSKMDENFTDDRELNSESINTKIFPIPRRVKKLWTSEG